MRVISKRYEARLDTWSTYMLLLCHHHTKYFYHIFTAENFDREDVPAHYYYSLLIRPMFRSLVREMTDQAGLDHGGVESDKLALIPYNGTT